MANLPIDVVCEVLDPIKSLDIQGANGLYQAIVAEMLLATGKPVGDLTINEVKLILDEANRGFLRVFQ